MSGSPDVQLSTGTVNQRRAILLHVTVTGKVVKVDAKNPQSGRQTTVVWLNERRYVGGEETHYTWIVVIPPYLEKAVERLAKEGKSLGVTAVDLWQPERRDGEAETVIAAVIQAEQIFIL